MQLQPLNIWVCPPCYDRPQIQLKTIILPPDPIPVFLPFPEPYTAEVPNYAITTTGLIMTTADGTPMTHSIEVTPNPDPTMPYLYPQDGTFPIPQE